MNISTPSVTQLYWRARVSQPKRRNPGVTMQFSGYHQSVVLLVKPVLDRFPIPLIDESTWSRLRQLKSQELARVQATRPSGRLFDEMTAELMPLAYSSAELNEAFASIDRQTFHQYQKAFFAGFSKRTVFTRSCVSRRRQSTSRILGQTITDRRVDTRVQITTNPLAR